MTERHPVRGSNTISIGVADEVTCVERALKSLPSLRIVLCMKAAPLPFGHTVGRWTHVLFRGLVQRGHRVTAFAVAETPGEADQCSELFPAPTYDLRTYLPPERGGLSAKWRTLRQPYSYMFSPDLVGDLALVLKQPWDVLHLEETWLGWLGLPYDRQRAVLNFHNLYCVDDGDYCDRDWKGASIRKLRHMAEKRLARAYPTLMTLSERLASELHLLAREATIHVCPLGLDMSLYPFIPSERRSSAPVVGLIGSMNWYPSLSAVERLLTRLWPAIKAQVREARCLVVGWGAREALRNYLTMPDLEVAENVSDIRPYFERTGVLLYAPSRGSGMKVKVMEAFAFGVPVVTTSEGVEGIPVEDGVHAGVCEDDAGLIARTVQLLTDRDRQERQRIAARTLVASHCGQQATLDTIEKVYATLSARPT